MTKIMIVEDDTSLREIYAIRMTAEGYTVVVAGDGEEALAVAVKERPDLILSDVMMPKISGFDMLDILRSTPETKDIKVVMMTALSSSDQRARGEQLGADRYLVKSQVGIEDVVNTIHEVLGDKNVEITNGSVTTGQPGERGMGTSSAQPVEPAMPTMTQPNLVTAQTKPVAEPQTTTTQPSSVVQSQATTAQPVAAVNQPQPTVIQSTPTVHQSEPVVEAQPTTIPTEVMNNQPESVKVTNSQPESTTTPAQTEATAV